MPEPSKKQPGKAGKEFPKKQSDNGEDPLDDDEEDLEEDEESIGEADKEVVEDDEEEADEDLDDEQQVSKSPSRVLSRRLSNAPVS
ncbi:MAG: hypothetical protein ACREJQ_00375 [bacterium]